MTPPLKRLRRLPKSRRQNLRLRRKNGFRNDAGGKSKPEDPIDVSAGIISNFAKMFAEQQKQKENPAEREKLKERLTAQTMSEIELGDGSLTIEAIVRDVVTGIVEKIWRRILISRRLPRRRLPVRPGNG